MALRPHLLYVYSWMPYPRRLLIYLRERHVPSSLVTVIPVTEPSNGDGVIPSLADKVPPRPKGSLPILAIPAPSTNDDSVSNALTNYHLLSQSSAIMTYLDTTLTSASLGPPLRPQASNPYITATSLSYTTLCENALATWNTPRLFGSKASPVSGYIPAAAKEGLSWVHRELAAIEAHLDPEGGRDLEGGGYHTRLSSEEGKPSHGDIMLLSFLELVDELYGKFEELTGGEKEEGGKDAYRRDVVGNGWYPNIREMYALWKKRASVVREGEEVIPKYARANAVMWADGVWDR